MKKCPKCDREYENNQKVCSNCNIEWVYLTKAANNIEFSIIESLLKTESIPVIPKTIPIDGFLNVLAGATFEGIDLMVPEDRHDEALAIINAPFEEDELFDADEEDEEEEE